MTMSSLKLAVCGILAISASCNSVNFVNTQTDALRQAKSLHSCWEPVDFENPAAGYKLSAPIYEFCSVMYNPIRESEVFVNGVDLESDNYEKFEAHFAEGTGNYAVLSICSQEAFSFQGPTKKAQTSLRCLCKRSGCNVPKPLNDFLKFNTHPIQLE
ncbi:unnamed protein product [Caenorhabditis nigoni]